MTVNSKTTQTKRRRTAECGTVGGHYKHLKESSYICQPCRDSRNSYRRSYQKLNPQARKDSDARYLANNPGQRTKYDKKYRDNNRDKTRAASLSWLKNNPEKNRQASRKRRAKKLQNEHSNYTENQVINLYGTDCYLCNKPINLTIQRRIGKEKGWQLSLHIDHIVPIIDGGPDTLENVRPTHAICNMKKGSRMAEDFEPEIDLDLFEDDDLDLDFVEDDFDELEEEDEDDSEEA